MVFEKLRDNKLFLKKEKCTFTQTRFKFLGHVIEQGKIGMDQSMSKVVKIRVSPKV